MSLIILKIGGSVITVKGSEYTARKDEIDRISQEILTFKADSKEGIIIVHGAGSYGHHQAMKWITGGFDAQDIYITHASVKALNSIVLESLNRTGIRALPIHPLSSCLLENGKITDFQIGPIRSMIERGIIPVLHGDVVMDKVLGASVLSGDRIVPYLSSVFIPSKIGAGNSVDGVLNDNGEVIKKITPISFIDFKKQIQGSTFADVTGGMLEKVYEFIELAKTGTNTRIFNASKKGMVSKFLYGEDVGTLITNI